MTIAIYLLLVLGAALTTLVSAMIGSMSPKRISLREQKTVDLYKALIDDRARTTELVRILRAQQRHGCERDN